MQRPDPRPTNTGARSWRVLLRLHMDPSGVQELKPSATLQRCFARHTQDYVQLSATPDQFKTLTEAVSVMQKTEPNYTARDLAEIRVPVTVAHSEHDEFIKREHAEYLVQSISKRRVGSSDRCKSFCSATKDEAI